MGFLSDCCCLEQVEEDGSGEGAKISLFEFILSTTVSLESGIPFTANSARREQRMKVLQRAKK